MSFPEKKKTFTKKSVKQSKNKECKKRHVSYESLSNISIVYNSVILKLGISTALVLWRKHKISKKTATWRLKKSQSNNKF